MNPRIASIIKSAAIATHNVVVSNNETATRPKAAWGAQLTNNPE